MFDCYVVIYFLIYYSYVFYSQSFCLVCLFFFFFFKQKTAYEMRISDWSSDVCSSDLDANVALFTVAALPLTVAAKFEASSAPIGVPDEIGRASRWERVCKYVLISVTTDTL